MDVAPISSFAFQRRLVSRRFRAGPYGNGLPSRHCDRCGAVILPDYEDLRSVCATCDSFEVADLALSLDHMSVTSVVAYGPASGREGDSASGLCRAWRDSDGAVYPCYKEQAHPRRGGFTAEKIFQDGLVPCRRSGGHEGDHDWDDGRHA